MKQLAIAFDLPKAIAPRTELKDLAHFLIPADGGLMLERQSSNGIAGLQPNQRIETAKPIERNHPFLKDFFDLYWQRQPWQSPVLGCSAASGQDQHGSGAPIGLVPQARFAVMAFHRRAHDERAQTAA